MNMVDSGQGPVPGRARGPVMVHVVSRVTEEVFSFLGPAIAALNSHGVAQLVVALDEPSTRRWLQRLDAQVQVRLVPTRGRLVGDLLRLRRVTIDMLRTQQELEGIHLHGLIPCAIGASVAATLGIRVPLYFSPHGSRLLGPARLLGKAVLWVSRRHGGAAIRSPIASHMFDLQRLERVVDSRVSLIESPVQRLFREVERRESIAPTIVGGGPNPADDAIAMFIQLVVLMRDTAAQPQFCWMGPVKADQAARLRSAGVRLVDRDDEADRARLLSEAWIYLAPAGGRGVPVGLTEAMAAGVACVAADTPYHHEVVGNRVSGFLYQTQAEAVQLIAALLDSPQQRCSAGQAARAEAARRFDDAAFSRRLLEAYEQAGQPAAAQVSRSTASRSAEGSGNAGTSATDAAERGGGYVAGAGVALRRTEVL